MGSVNWSGLKYFEESDIRGNNCIRYIFEFKDSCNGRCRRKCADKKIVERRLGEKVIQTQDKHNSDLGVVVKIDEDDI